MKERRGEDDERWAAATMSSTWMAALCLPDLPVLEERVRRLSMCASLVATAFRSTSDRENTTTKLTGLPHHARLRK